MNPQETPIETLNFQLKEAQESFDLEAVVMINENINNLLDDEKSFEKGYN